MDRTELPIYAEQGVSPDDPIQRAGRREATAVQLGDLWRGPALVVVDRWVVFDQPRERPVKSGRRSTKHGIAPEFFDLNLPPLSEAEAL